MSSSGVNHTSQPCIYERKSRLTKWLGKLFNGSGRGTSNGRYPQLIGEENAVWRAPSSSRSMDNQSRAENDELDRAIALSLAEAEDARKPNGYGRCSNKDEELARALHESLNNSSYPPYNPARFCPRICVGCNREIGFGHYLSSMGAFWHPFCLRCRSCLKPITEPEFSLSGSDPYHKSCYKELHHPKCDVCHQFIPTNKAGLIEYRAHPFWSQKYCPSHEHDRTTRCCSCERLESKKTRYVSLGDGRSLCLECLDSAVLDTGECQPLYHAIRDYFEGMNMKLDQQIPMLLVERQALNEAMEGEKDGHHHMPETRGLCLSEEQTVSSIYKKPKIGRSFIPDMRTQKQKLTRKCEVTAILVLYGLPRLLTGSILAHELMHGWLRLKALTPNLKSCPLGENVLAIVQLARSDVSLIELSTNLTSGNFYPNLEFNWMTIRNGNVCFSGEQLEGVPCHKFTIMWLWVQAMLPIQKGCSNCEKQFPERMAGYYLEWVFDF